MTDKVIVTEQDLVLVGSDEQSLSLALTSTDTGVTQVESVTDVIEIRSPSTVLIEEQNTVVVAAGAQGPQGPRGEPGAAGAPSIEVNFAFGDASPAVITLAEAGKVIYGVKIHIVTPFDGSGAALIIGDAVVPDRLMKSFENDPTQAGSNETNPAYAYGADTQVILTITPGGGASQGSGLVTVTIQQ